MREGESERDVKDSESGGGDTLIYLTIKLYYHTIITLDIHYIYCIYVSIIVVSYIAIDDDDDNECFVIGD